MQQSWQFGVAIGHLTMAQNANSITSFTGFDALGRVLAHSQLTAGKTYSFAYAYNLAGGLISETYPSNRTVATCYDLAGRVSQVGGSCQSLGATASPTPYISGIGTGSGVQYAPQGAPSNYQYGNGVQRTATYNARLQPSNIVDQANSLQLLNMTWYWYPQNGSQSVNNGNLRNLSYFEGGPGYPTVVSFNQSFTYDTLNRLSGVSDSGYSRIFNYDAYGNMYVPPAAATPPGWTGIAPSGYLPNSVSAYNGLNQLNAAGYDGNGNQVSFNDSRLTYDAENRQTQMVYGGTTENYTYDADGKRVSKNADGGPQSVFVYDAMGHMAAEYSTATESSPCTTCYLSADHLGSARLVTDQSGNVVARHDYLPFGEEIAANTAGRDSHWGPFNDSINQKFTGKERDSESGLDYFGARYYGSALGRFTSPDEPLIDQDPHDPQSWNLYSYVRNNPLSNIDPTGEDCITTSQTSNTLTVTTARGGSAETCSGTYVNGTVDVNSYSYNSSKGGSLSWSDNSANTGGAINFASSASTASGNTDWSPGSSNMIGARMIGMTAPIGNAISGAIEFFILGPGAGLLEGPGPENRLGKLELPSPSRPKGVPENWVKVPDTKGKGGYKFADPNNPNFNYVRVRADGTITQVKNGQTLDVNGSPVKQRTPDAHFPSDQFTFRP